MSCPTSIEVIIADTLLHECARDVGILCGLPEASDEELFENIKHFIDKIAQSFEQTDFDMIDLEEYTKHFFYGQLEYVDFDNSSSSFDVSKEEAQRIIDTDALNDIPDDEKFWIACYVVSCSIYDDLDLADEHAVELAVRGFADGHSNASEYYDRAGCFGEPAMYINTAPARRILEQIASEC